MTVFDLDKHEPSRFSRLPMDPMSSNSILVSAASMSPAIAALSPSFIKTIQTTTASRRLSRSACGP